MYMVIFTYDGVVEKVYIFNEYEQAVEYFCDCLKNDYNIPNNKHKYYLNQEYFENGNNVMTLVKKSDIHTFSTLYNIIK